MNDAIRQAIAREICKGQQWSACGCIGPQNGEPRCPCAMRGVIKRNGQWVQGAIDLGPAPPDKPISIGISAKDQS